MKSPLLITLSVIGVLGTAAAAMAVNSNTLGAIDQGTIGRAAQVLAPVGTVSATPTPVPTLTPVPGVGDLNNSPLPPVTNHDIATSTGDDSSGSTHDADHEEQHSSDSGSTHNDDD